MMPAPASVARPASSRSRSRVRSPSRAARYAAVAPTTPPPATMRSNAAMLPVCLDLDRGHARSVHPQHGEAVALAHHGGAGCRDRAQRTDDEAGRGRVLARVLERHAEPPPEVVEPRRAVQPSSTLPRSMPASRVARIAGPGLDAPRAPPLDLTRPQHTQFASVHPGRRPGAASRLSPR